MNTKMISNNALDIINQYKDFSYGGTQCSIPYFNNKRLMVRGGLRSLIGKGSPKDIFEEIEHISIENKMYLKNIGSYDLKKFLIYNNLGIDCSGFAFYVLNEESISRGKGSLDKHIAFPLCKGVFGKIKCKMRPVENFNVATIAHSDNTKIIQIKDIDVGDIITMVGGPDNGERDHVMIIHQIEYQNFIPITIHYCHAIAWPTDGEYGHGIHFGKIDILDINKSIVENKWTENEKTGAENYTFSRALKSITEIRRFNWF